MSPTYEYRCYQCNDIFTHKSKLKFKWQEFCSKPCFLDRWFKIDDRRYYDKYADL